jgi:tellurite resistance protein TerC
VFIGCKICAVNLFGKMPPWISLGTTFGLVAGGIAYSLWRTRQDERALRTP